MARLFVTSKPSCQKDLKFAEIVSTVVKKQRAFWSIWKTIRILVVMLYERYLEENSDYRDSYGSLLNLKPFYIHNVSLADVEMCVCKLHLPGQ